MTSSLPLRNARLLGLAIGVGVALSLTGCGGKEEETAAAPPVPRSQPAEAAEAAPAQEESTTETAGGSGLAATVDVNSTMKAADAAIKQNDLMKATDALLKLQVSGAMNNNPQAKMDHYQRMVDLQQRVAQAAASGDPKAQQAAALMRQAGRAQ